jgi:hypothetical protein
MLAAFITGIVYFVILRSLYPIPSFYSDSFTWVGAAQTGQPVTFRPVGYSKVMMFFRLLSTNDIALIAGQYFSNLLTNLFLFFTCNYFFSLRKGLKLLLYLILILNPFYLFYSNYISSDPFFNCLAVFWFTLLIWIMYRPSWFLIFCQLTVLAALFELRYNAIFFPAISTIAVLLSKMSLLKKVTAIVTSLLLIATIVTITTYVTKKYTGTKTFSAFSGWQLANNGLHVMQHSKIDTNRFSDREVKSFARFAIHFFDTTKQTFPDSAASAVFMWHINSPLKRYMTVYPKRSRYYFATWNKLGPIYNEFGKEIILQKPFTYFQHFVLPNTKAYFFPPLEIYETYMENRHTIAAAARKYYQYKNNKTPVHHPTVYAVVFTPMPYLFTAVNISFVLIALYYLLFKRYREQSRLFNHTLLCFTAFFLANFFFIVLLAPSVFRYHIFILTLSFPVLTYLIQAIVFEKMEKLKALF